MAHARLGAAAGACLVVLACGGSGSGNDAAPTDPPPAGLSPGPTAGPSAGTPPAAPPPAAAPDPVAPVGVKALEIVSGLSSPWSLAFLPDGSMLVTERTGTLRRITAAGAVSAPLAGMPAVADVGQGGLLDVVLSPGFAADRTIFFTYSEPVAGGQSRTAVARAELGETGVTNLSTIYRQTPARPGSIHYGSRLVFDRAGHLYVTMGDRGEGAAAQDLATTQGKVVRILPNGAIPTDNPVFGQPGALPGIWSYGHRNPQGATLNPVTGELWLSEHGPRGGDEINRVLPGRNYGWPRITYGRDYNTGAPLGEGTTAPDVEPPVHYWVPTSVAPAGMVFYTGDKLPGWQGSLLVGTLAGEMLAKLTLQGDAVTGETRHLQSSDQRIRDIRQGPDGYPYLLTDSGRLMRVVPQ